jgi:hypothetical protein
MEDVQVREKEHRYEGLTTAALAVAGERTAFKQELAPEAEFQGPVHNGGAAIAIGSGEQATPLFSPDEAKEFRVRWDTIQGGFVDEPRRAVEQADSLVAGAMKRLAEIFAGERAELEGQWDREKTVSTEDLRLALRRYRSFFGRLLSV